LKIGSPILLVETIAGYSVAGVLMLLYYKAIDALPQMLGEDPWPVFWLVEFLAVCGLILWVWVALYSSQQVWLTFVGRWGRLGAALATLASFFGGVLLSSIVFIVLLSEQIGYLEN
jgi:hypothetical protein